MQKKRRGVNLTDLKNSCLKIGQRVDLYVILLVVLIIAGRTFFTNQLFTATAVTGMDEIGTMASAAYFAGYDWSEIISDTLYYGFGYSVLLAPIYMFFKDPVTIHHMLLFANSVLIALSGAITYKILIRFFQMKNRKTALLIAASTVLYFNLSFNGNMMLNECMLQLLIWIMLYLVLLLNETAPGRKKNLYTFLLGGGYFIVCWSIQDHWSSLSL